MALVWLVPVLVVMGVSAGVLTTLTGQGGGVLLLLLCSMWMGPRAALAVTAPALLLGNVHRAYLFRSALDRPMAKRLVMGALPGGLVGGFLAGVVSPMVLKVLLGVMTLIAIAKAVGVVSFRLPRAVLGPAGFVVGAMTGTSGGAGILFSPILLSAGLTGSPYVATISLVAAVTHFARVVAYGTSGLLTRELVLPIVVIGATIFVGNSLGERLRRRISDRGTTWLEYGTLVACVTLSLLGVRP
ncbi:hypothetical protein AKJ09_00924 [Labilithrix luteola]|uniref:Probable membrane transporter protein n=1 Tax=Labilithrix luteola TaxID=1391654 RepID=A0A0K1PL64_9BACT|nr:sulfite exporter TauE/SafE family protein [Labilithrix luteola]AKU94260.1 hypothetical protein AKJ09_00924 [Labilithrix luteola]